MYRKTLLVAAVATLLVASGCLGNGGTQQTETTTTEPPVDVAQLRQDSVEASKNLDTAKYEMSMTASLEQGTLEMSATGAIDRADRKQRLDMTMNLDGEGTSRTIDVETYLDDTTMYTKVMGRWRVQDVAGQNMWSQTRIDRNRRLMESDAVSVTYDGTATVRGTQTHVLKLTADDREEFEELMRQQMAAQGQSSSQELLANSEITDFTMRSYIATDSRQVRKVEMEMTLDHQRQGRMDLTMSVVYYGINEDVTITIPEEAKRSLRPGLAPTAPA